MASSLEKPPSAGQGDDDAGPSLPMLQAMFEWKYVIQVKAFVHPVSHSTLDIPQYNLKFREATFSDRGRRIDAAEHFFDTSGRRVDLLTYAPGRDELFHDSHDRSVLNLWRRSPLTPTYGDIGPWQDLLTHVFPDVGPREHFIDYWARVIQHPGEKINHALLIGSAEGVGKDSLLRPVWNAIGRSNVGEITPLDLQSPYTDWLQERKVVVVPELKAFSKKDLANTLKPLLASPPETLRINPKGIRQFTIPNLVQLVFMTNYEEPIALDEGDRRWSFYWSPAEPLKPSAYRDYHRWCDKHASDVYGYLLRRDVSGFNPKARPPMTDAKQALIEASKTDLERWLIEAHAAQIPPLDHDLVTMDTVIGALPDSLKRSTSTHAVGKILRSLGARKLSRQARFPSGQRPPVWALRRFALYDAMSEKALTERLESAQTISMVQWTKR